MSEAREKAFMVFGDVVLDTNLIAGVVGTTVWMETGQVLPVGYLAAQKVREWIDGLYEEGGEGGDPEEEPEETTGEDAGEAEAEPTARVRMRNVTDEEVEQWVQWRADGMSIQDIARLASRPYATVARRLSEAQRAARDGE